jgi:hypothetical protein
MSKNADITLIDNANALEYLLELSIDDTLFPNLISITEFHKPLSSYCSPKPIILLYEGEKYITYLLTAIGILNNQPRRYIDRSGNYNPTSYGFILRNADEEPYALGAWARLKKFIWPGYKLTTWLNDINLPILKFKVISITDTNVTIRTVVDEQLITINKIDFYEIAKGWEGYKIGQIPNNALKNKSILFPYILGLLHWMDQEGRLNNLPKY